MLQVLNAARQATADYSDEMMHAALDVSIPHYASAIVTTDEIVDAISSLQRSGLGAQTVAIGHS
jgi:ureidoacrylate peracid hydrolase